MGGKEKHGSREERCDMVVGVFSTAEFGLSPSRDHVNLHVVLIATLHVMCVDLHLMSCHHIASDTC